MQARLNCKDELLEEKQKRQAAVAREVEKRKAVEQTLDKLYDWIGELHAKINTANKEIRAADKKTRSAKKAKTKADTLSAERLALLTNLRSEMQDLRDQLADESKQRAALERMQVIHLEIKRRSRWGVVGGPDGQSISFY